MLSVSKKFRKTRSKKGGEPAKPDDCSICKEPMDDSNKLITTDCKHTFHKDCLRRWCQSQAINECPLCRANISKNCSSLIETESDAATRIFNAIRNNQFNEVKDIIESEIQNTDENNQALRNEQLNHFFSSRDINGDTFIIAAIRIGNIDTVGYLLDLVNRNIIPNIDGKNYLNLVNEQDGHQSALHIAIYKEDMNIVNMLLNNPLIIDLNIYNSDGNTAVIYAIWKNDLDLLKTLVNKGAFLYGSDIIDYQPIALMESLRPDVSNDIFQYLLTLSPEQLGRTYENFMKSAKWMLRAYANADAFSQPRLSELNDYITKHSRTTGGKLRSTKKRRTIRKKNKKPTRKARK